MRCPISTTLGIVPVELRGTPWIHTHMSYFDPDYQEEPPLCPMDEAIRYAQSQRVLSAGDRLAVRCAVASLDLLKTASLELDISIEHLSEQSLREWLFSKQVQR